MKKYQLLLGLAFAGLTVTGFGQNVGIGTSTPSQKLHVSDATLPNSATIRVSGLSSTTTLAAGTGPFSVVIVDANGVMYRGGTAGAGNNNAWMILGNAGTTVATNFLGTTDNISLAIRTNNLERMRVVNNGQVVVNNTAPFAGDVFSSYAGGTDDAIDGYATGTGIAGYFQETGGGLGVGGVTASATGLAGSFLTNFTTGTNTSPTVQVYNIQGSGVGLFVRTDGNSNTADGMELDINGTSTKRGIDMYVDAANTGLGMAIFHDGNGRGINIQNSLATLTQPTIFGSNVATGARVMSLQNTNVANATMIGFFSQGSTGLVTATFQNAAAVWGQSTGIRGSVFLASGASTNTVVTNSQYSGVAGNFDGIGVYGRFTPNPGWGYGVVGEGQWFGVFANGDLGASGLKPFMIDHPLDPSGKLLKHFSLESDEVLNMYRGTVILDASGRATVELPSYFASINKDFSYQLTPVGAHSDVFIQTEIASGTNTFVIAGGNPGQKICWNVFAERNDAYIQQNPSKIQVEINKKPEDMGKYLQPELYNQPKESGIFFRYSNAPVQNEEGVKPEINGSNVQKPLLQDKMNTIKQLPVSDGTK